MFFTQFCGFMLRPPQETFKTILKNLTEDEGVSISEGFRGFTPARGTTPIRGFTPTPSHSRGTTPPASGQRYTGVETKLNYFFIQSKIRYLPHLLNSKTLQRVSHHILMLPKSLPAPAPAVLLLLLLLPHHGPAALSPRLFLGLLQQQTRTGTVSIHS